MSSPWFLIAALLACWTAHASDAQAPIALVPGTSVLGRLDDSAEKAEFAVHSAAEAALSCSFVRYASPSLPGGRYEIVLKSRGFRGWLELETPVDARRFVHADEDGTALLRIETPRSDPGSVFTVRVLALAQDSGPFVLRLRAIGESESLELLRDAESHARMPIGSSLYAFDEETLPAGPALDAALMALDVQMAMFPDVDDATNMLLYKAGLQLGAGRVKQARAAIDEAWRRLAANPESHPRVRAGLCSAEVRMALETGDLPGLRRAVDGLLAVVGDVNFEGYALANEFLQAANAFEEFQDEEQVLELTRLALAVAADDPSSPPRFRALLHTRWAQALSRRGEGEAALSEIRYAQAVLAESVGRDSRAYVNHLVGVGSLLQRNGRPHEARVALDEGLAGAACTLGEMHPLYASALRTLALVQRDLGDQAGALDSAERAAAAFEAWAGPGHPSVIDARSSCARIAAGMGRLDLAWSHAFAAVGSGTTMTKSAFQALSDAERMQFLSAYRDTLDLLLSLPPIDADPTLDDRVYARVLDWKGSASHALARTRAAAALSSDPEASAAREELHVVQSRLAALANAYQPERSGDVERLRKRRDALERDLAQRNGDAATSVEPGSVRSALPAHAALVDFVQYTSDGAVGETTPRGPRLCAWISRRDAARVARVDLGPARAIDAAVDDFLLSIAVAPERGLGVARTSGPVESRDEAGRALAQLVWTPIAAALGDATVVVVSPDGSLGRLPFATLPDDEGRFLLETHEFVHVSAASAIVESSAPTGVLGSLLLVGGLDYEGNDERPRADAWPSLPGTKREVDAIAELYGGAQHEGVRRLTGTEGTEARLKTEIGRHDIVHLATHGFADGGGSGSAPAASLSLAKTRIGLVCAAPAPGAGADSDGLLTAEEIGWLDLSGVKLVVLSACSSGLGASVSGEGMLGLRREFQQAGVARVLSALWPVPDAETADLMTGFYSGLRQRQLDAPAALRSAQLEMLARDRAAGGGGNPGAWGAFVLDGGI